VEHLDTFPDDTEDDFIILGAAEAQQQADKENNSAKGQKRPLETDKDSVDSPAKKLKRIDIDEKDIEDEFEIIE
jgi:hypothetical protein